MTSTSVTRMGGVVVVTQVIPHDEGSIQLQTAAPSTQAPPPATQAPPPASTKMDDMKGVFLRGEPQGLGVRRKCVPNQAVTSSYAAKVFIASNNEYVALC